MVRFPELKPGHMLPEQQKMYDAIANSPRKGVRGPFIPLLYSPEITDRVQHLGTYIRFETSLPPWALELTILLVARHCSAGIEWAAHVSPALEQGIAQETIDAIAARTQPAGMPEDQAAVYDFVQSLLHRYTVDDAVFERILEIMDRKSIIDLSVTCGYFCTMAFILGVSQINAPPEKNVPFPPPA